MPVFSQASFALPGSPLHALFTRNIGRTVELQTTVGSANGTLSEINPAYVTLTNLDGEEHYVLLHHIVSLAVPAGN